jgi:hypothetical protein
MEFLGGIKDLLLYNRANYMFNREIEMERAMQIQKQRVDQINLFREDLRDLFNLTIVKMDKYLIINSLTLAFTLGFYYEGRLPADAPSWIIWLWSISLVSAILYLVLSVWFAIHAVITAQTLAVQLLTQWLRLPVPTARHIDMITPTLEDFEKQSVKSLLRLPLISDYLRKPESSHDSVPFSRQGIASQSSDLNSVLKNYYTEFLCHFILHENLQEDWKYFDAYSRIAMVLGSLQLLNVISYFSMATYLIDKRKIGAVCFVLCQIAFTVLHIQHNICGSWKLLMLVHVLSVIAILFSVAASICSSDEPASKAFVLLSYFAHFLLSGAFLAFVVDKTKLGKRFATLALKVSVFSNGSLLQQLELMDRDSSIRRDPSLSSTPHFIFLISSAVVFLLWFASLIWQALNCFGLSIPSLQNSQTLPNVLENSYLLQGY